MEQTEMAAEIVARGRQALVDALGPAGALLYMQELLKESTEEGSDGADRVSFGFGVSHETRRVIVRFNRPVTWLRMTAQTARETAKNLNALAQELEPIDG